jgi:hypothetical protein
MKKERKTVIRMVILIVLGFLMMWSVKWVIEYFSQRNLDILNNQYRIDNGIPVIEKAMVTSGWDPDNADYRDAQVNMQLQKQQCPLAIACHLSKIIDVTDFKVVVERDVFLLEGRSNGLIQDSLLTISLATSLDAKVECPWFFSLETEGHIGRIGLRDVLEMIERWKINYPAISHWIRYMEENHPMQLQLIMGRTTFSSPSNP